MSLPSYDAALSQALSIVNVINVHETGSLAASVGRVLAKDIISDRNLPPYDRSQMDGYAVVASEVKEGVSMEVTARISAGSNVTVDRTPNTCVAIATGAPVPTQFDAVVQHELTDRGNLLGGKVTFHVDNVKQGKAIHACGADASSGMVVLHAGTQLDSHHIGIAATVGNTTPCLVCKPKVIVVTSGDEVVSPTELPEKHQIRNGNGPMLVSLFESFGCDVLHHQHVIDDASSTTSAVSEALQLCDLLVTVGGISAGERDFFPQAFENAEVEILVNGSAIQPGKPVMVGKKDGKMVLGLPGNPVSALACAHLFGHPIVRAMLGIHEPLLWLEIPLAHAVIPNKHRTVFRPCNIVDGKIEIPTWQGSGDLSHTSQTIGVAQLPMIEDEIPSGTLVLFLRFA